MTKEELIDSIYNAPYIIPVEEIRVSLMDKTRNICIIQTTEKVSDNEVLAYAAKLCGGRWMMWTIAQENPYQDGKEMWNYILKLVK